MSSQKLKLDLIQTINKLSHLFVHLGKFPMFVHFSVQTLEMGKINILSSSKRSGASTAMVV